MPQRYDNTTAQPWAPVQVHPGAMPDNADLHREQPARPASFVADVLVPSAQAAISALLLSALVAYLAARLGMDDWPTLMLGVFLAVMAGVWALVLVQSRQLLWAAEHLTRRDWDKDGRIGRPEMRTLRVELKAGQTWFYIDAGTLDIDDDDLIAFARGVTLEGRSLSESEWGSDPAFPAGVNAWRAFRTKLLSHGLIELVNPKAPSQGYRLTHPGRAVLGRLARDERAHARARANGGVARGIGVGGVGEEGEE